MNMNQQSYFPSFPACGKSNPSINNRKRKVEQDDDLSMQNSSSSQPMSFDGFNAPSNKKARMVPLGAEENYRTLASLGYLPGQGNGHPIPFSTRATFRTSDAPSSPISLDCPDTPDEDIPEDSTCPLPSFCNVSSLGEDHPEGRRASFSYPKFDIYPSSNGQSESHSGILGPDTSSSEDDMECDGDVAMDRGHGPQCKSIPQLSVRYADGKESALWATCIDCGASSKVQSNQPSTGLVYSP